MTNHKHIRFEKCPQCGRDHVEIDVSRLTASQLAGTTPVYENFVCPDIARMYRVLAFALDTTASAWKQNHLPPEARERLIAQTTAYLQAEWGVNHFDKKLQRFLALDIYLLGLPEDYYEHLRQVIAAYCCGNFYPAQTAAGALGERILNRLIIKTRNHFKHTTEFKRVQGKDSFDNWDMPISVLERWGVISKAVADDFRKLKRHRNDSVHYRDGYDFENNSFLAVRLVAAIVNGQFNYYNRRDIFWVFDVPGEIWVRSTHEKDPFVVEFVLPHCLRLTPYDEPTTTPPHFAKGTPLKPLSDEEFIRLRKTKA